MLQTFVALIRLNLRLESDLRIRVQRRYTRTVAAGLSTCGLVFIAATVLAQTQPTDAPRLRGVLLECDAGADGEFAIRGPGSEVILYRFDAKTRVERNGMTAALQLLRPGEEIEVSSSPIADSPLRYATLVTALERVAPPAIARVPRKPANPISADLLFPRGDLTFSGVVSYLKDGRLILRTQNGAEQTITLRRDTRYLAGGGIAAASDLKANMHVFVRAGKGLFGDTEAYQVIWGAYLQP